ncbi:CpsB/CapC family capsule biosynthesis tyrosine phosphatase [Paraglaciecola sp.]|uniref:CpsB/CapC family capsule biosynthesis tyrosine phosphatase n=1 Tax=Paraglaciecola sp. TaxID=1920173 RepID=UPI0032632AA9
MIPNGSDHLVRWVNQRNIMLIIVHPERNQSFLRNAIKLQAFIDLGCYLQVTASSLTEKVAHGVRVMAEKFLVHGHVSTIASDCHNVNGRAPHLLEGLKIIVRG